MLGKKLRIANFYLPVTFLGLIWLVLVAPLYFTGWIFVSLYILAIFFFFFLKG